jgi:hypothetical protein
METRIYQARLLPKEFSQPFNVVIIMKTNLRTQAWAYVLLFSSDLALAWEKLIDYANPASRRSNHDACVVHCCLIRDVTLHEMSEHG